MNPGFVIERTTTEDPRFLALVEQLDNELWNELEEDQATYDQYNKVPEIKTAVLALAGPTAVACGCFKSWNTETAEIKRMFVQKSFRGQGVSRLILNSLEEWARENGHKEAVLETSIYFDTAKNLYHSSGYEDIPAYPPYEGLEESVCMRKTL